MTKPTFPKKIYVRREYDGDQSWLIAEETAQGIVAADCEEEIGVYELVCRAKAIAPTQIIEIKPRRK